MARQIPQSTDVHVEQRDDPSVLYLDDEQTRTVVSALSSDTGHSVFRLLTQEALSASEVADELDVTVQSVGYHLENLQQADLVEVIDVCYSEKGREMELYAVTSDPKVLVLASQSERSHLRHAFAQMAGAVGISGVLLACWHYVSTAFERVLDV